MDLQVGSTVGDYQVVDILGAGGMGKVYKVRNTISDRIEALKVLLPDLATEPELADRFLREIKVQASLVHPNIATLHTALRVDNQLLMLMELVEGVTLEQKIKDGPLPAADAVNYVMQVLAALDFAHSHGVIHRDIKPANMMLTPEGVVKLMDFGIAKAATDRKLTMTGTTLGSLYYMSPEQIQGAQTLDGRSDLYSVGVSLYELVTGKRPFDGDSQFAIMSAHLEKTPVPPVTVDPKLPQMLNDIILMSVAKDPAARFQTAGAFRNALSNVGLTRATTAPIAAPASPAAAAAAKDSFHLIEPTKPQAPKGRRGLWMALGAVAAVVVLIAAIEFGPWKGTRAAQQQQVATPAPQPQTQTPAPQAQPVSAPAEPVPAAPQPVATTAPKPVSPSAKNSRPQLPVVPAQQAQVSQPQPSASSPAAALQPAPQAPLPQQPVQQAAPARPPGASHEELQQAREQLAMLGARAGGIRTSLQSLQRSQAASGLNLRGDMQEASNLMTTYLDGANAALNDGNATQAKSFMDKAERQIEKLEKFLGR
jgi:serine/threonine-protein kinase